MLDWQLGSINQQVVYRLSMMSKANLLAWSRRFETNIQEMREIKVIFSSDTIEFNGLSDL